MDHLSRRRFFQGAAGVLGSVGLSHLSLERRAIRYGQTLAQNTRRKIALLVGVNDYAREPLSGSHYDVELQKQLLVHRFGFLPQDVHTLTCQQPTRQGILDAFNQYLLTQVRENDVVVFHFSGHGARVQEYKLMQEFLQELGTGCLDQTAGCQNTTISPLNYEQRGSRVQDIMGHTLLLLRSALPTDQVTFVLDCCYSGGGKRGNVVMRSRDIDLINGKRALPELTDEEWPYQEQLLRRLGWGPQEFVNQIKSKAGKGFFVAAARANQQSADYPFDGFTAGAFTYLLTQYLWHETSPLSVTIPIVASSTTRLSEHSQVPEYDPKNMPKVDRDPIYHEPPVSKPAEAMVKGIAEDGQLSLWLGGLEPSSLAAFDQGVMFTVIDRASGEIFGQASQIDGSRKGLESKGIWMPLNPDNGPETVVGHLLQEKLRGIPEKITLRVGLDDTLNLDEKTRAEAALHQFKTLEIFDAIAREEVHVLIGRYTCDIDARMAQNNVSPKFIPSVGGIGFFSATQEPLYESSFGEPEETIEAAINRLTPRFSSLLIRRMLALMVNPYSQQLGVGLMIDHQGSRSGITSRGGAGAETFIPVQSERGIERVPEGHKIEVIVENEGPYDLHVGLVVIDAAGAVNVVFPFSSDDEKNDVIYRRETRRVTTLQGAEPYGLPELLLLASPQSLRTTLRKLRQVAPTFDAPKQSLEAEAGEVSVNDVIADMLGVLNDRRGEGDASALPAGPRSVGVEQVAVISRLFHVVPAE